MSNAERTMRMIALSDITNILGMLGIIGSLIFVGVEMKQSHTIAMAAQIQDRYSMISNYHIALMTEGEVARDLIRRNIFTLDYDALNPDEQSVFIQIRNFYVNQYQSIFAQHELGLISQDVWEQTVSRLKGTYVQCEWRPAFNGVTENMRNFLDSLPSDCVTRLERYPSAN
jgi:hypothetical protein